MDKFVNGEITEETRAEAIYYKTIMYMVRFNCKTGFLFYPLPNNGDSYIVVTDKEIVSLSKSHLIMMGLNISQNSEDFRDFCREMKNNEDEFIKRLDNIMDNSTEKT